MKIIQIGSYPQDNKCIKGGIESSIFGLSNELKKQNRVYVFDLPRNDVNHDFIEENEGVFIYRFHSRGSNLRSILRCNYILKTIKNLRPDICHLHSSSFFSLILFLFLKISKIPVLITIHGLAHIEKGNELNKHFSFANIFKYFFQSLCEFLLLTFCNQIIVDTEYVAVQIKRYWKQKKIFRIPKCIIIPQGIDSSFYCDKQQTEVQEGMLLSVGGINSRKGHLKLIQMMPQILEQYPYANLVIAGALTNTLYYNQLNEEIEKNNLGKHVSLIINATSEVIYQLYFKADLFVLHSEEESQGIVLCEAMAMGKPIVATNVGGIPYVINNKINGLLCGYGDVKTFADNVMFLLSNRENCNTMRIANIKSSYKYSWQVITTEIMKVYTSI